MSTKDDDSTIDLSGLDAEPLSSDDLKDVSDVNEEFHIKHLDSADKGIETFHEEPFRSEPVGAFHQAKIGGELPRPAGGDFGGLVSEPHSGHPQASDRVKVKFDKFITLVATHTFEDVLKQNADEDVIISTNLLTDLANAHEEETESKKKLPVIFATGIILGLIAAWLIMRGGEEAAAAFLG